MLGLLVELLGGVLLPRQGGKIGETLPTIFHEEHNKGLVRQSDVLLLRVLDGGMLRN
jgi:hypothetical protein